MSALVFVDTNVHLYTKDTRDAAKQIRANEWLTWCWTQRAGRTSTQVLNEYYNNALTKFKAVVTVERAREQVRMLRLWQPPHLDSYTVDGAWAMQDKYKLSYWDALIMSSAQQQGCRYMLSEDMQHLQTYDTVQVINPFLIAPTEFLAFAVGGAA
jgi:predicted nucleic acid-binding protein